MRKTDESMSSETRAILAKDLSRAPLPEVTAKAFGALICGIVESDAERNRIVQWIMVVWWGVLLFFPLPGHRAMADTACPSSIWITYGEQTRQKNGAVTQRFYIETGDGAGSDNLSGLAFQAFYRLGPPLNDVNGFHKAPILSDAGGVYLDIQSPTSAQVDLYVFGTCGDTRWTAQTTHRLHGKAWPDTQPPLAPGGRLPEGLARLDLTPERDHYYMQTGKSYHFSYTGLGGPIETASVLENGKPVAQIPMMPGNVLDYTPLHDPSLERSGPHAAKELVVCVEERTVGWRHAATYTLRLHRSIHAHSRLLSGVGLFLATAITVLIMVMVHKRRPWIG